MEEECDEYGELVVPFQLGVTSGLQQVLGQKYSDTAK